jgi:hypothetical protein
MVNKTIQIAYAAFRALFAACTYTAVVSWSIDRHIDQLAGDNWEILVILFLLVGTIVLHGSLKQFFGNDESFGSAGSSNSDESVAFAWAAGEAAQLAFVCAPAVLVMYNENANGGETIDDLLVVVTFLTGVLSILSVVLSFAYAWGDIPILAKILCFIAIAVDGLVILFALQSTANDTTEGGKVFLWITVVVGAINALLLNLRSTLMALFGCLQGFLACFGVSIGEDKE